MQVQGSCVREEIENFKGLSPNDSLKRQDNTKLKFSRCFFPEKTAVLTIKVNQQQQLTIGSNKTEYNPI